MVRKNRGRDHKMMGAKKSKTLKRHRVQGVCIFYIILFLAISLIAAYLINKEAGRVHTDLYKSNSDILTRIKEIESWMKTQ